MTYDDAVGDFTAAGPTHLEAHMRMAPRNAANILRQDLAIHGRGAAANTHCATFQTSAGRIIVAHSVSYRATMPWARTASRRPISVKARHFCGRAHQQGGPEVLFQLLDPLRQGWL